MRLKLKVLSKVEIRKKSVWGTGFVYFSLVSGEEHAFFMHDGNNLLDYLKKFTGDSTEILYLNPSSINNLINIKKSFIRSSDSNSVFMLSNVSFI